MIYTYCAHRPTSLFLEKSTSAYLSIFSFQPHPAILPTSTSMPFFYAIFSFRCSFPNSVKFLPSFKVYVNCDLLWSHPDLLIWAWSPFLTSLLLPPISSVYMAPGHMIFFFVICFHYFYKPFLPTKLESPSKQSHIYFIHYGSKNRAWYRVGDWYVFVEWVEKWQVIKTHLLNWTNHRNFQPLNDLDMCWDSLDPQKGCKLCSIP